MTAERQRRVNVEHAKNIQTGKPGQPTNGQPKKQRDADADRANRMQAGKPDRTNDDKCK